MSSSQKRLEVIHARNLIASVSTPAFLTGPHGVLEYYNDAAAAMLGRAFGDKGRMAPEEWTAEFGPLRPDGEPIPWLEIDLTQAMIAGDPGHSTHTMRTGGGETRRVNVTMVPIVGDAGFSGAVVFFWPSRDNGQPA